MSQLLVVADVVSALLIGVAAAFFLVVWRASREPHHLLFSIGLALSALGVSAVSASQREISAHVEEWTAVRVAAYTAGPLVLLFAYLDGRSEAPGRRWWTWGSLTAAAAVAIILAYWLVPALSPLLPPAESLLAAHVFQFVTYLGCAGLSFAGFLRAPRPDRLLVPLSFLAWSITKYTWILIDVTRDDRLIGFVLVWRFLAIALLLSALLLPVRGEAARAPP